MDNWKKLDKGEISHTLHHNDGWSYKVIIQPEDTLIEYYEEGVLKYTGHYPAFCDIQIFQTAIDLRKEYLADHPED